MGHGMRFWFLGLYALAALPPGLAAQSLPENRGFATVSAIIREHCAQCHAWATTYKGIADPSRIIATLPEKSLLFRKIADDSMPPTDGKLGSQEKALIRAWLAAGASPGDAPVTEEPVTPKPCPCGLPQKPAPAATPSDQ
jgi:mono/diheme cytochrome c family protein